MDFEIDNNGNVTLRESSDRSRLLGHISCLPLDRDRASQAAVAWWREQLPAQRPGPAPKPLKLLSKS